MPDQIKSTPEEQEHIPEKQEHTTSQKSKKQTTDNISCVFSNSTEGDKTYRENILKQIKEIRNEEDYKRLITIYQVCDKIKGKDIPTEYKQKIIDEIGLLGGFNAIVYCQEIFKGANIENCVYNTLKMGRRIDRDYMQQLRYRNTFNPTELLELILTIEINDDKNRTTNVENAIKEIIIIYTNGNNEENNKETLKKLINKILDSEYFYIIPEIQRTLRKSFELEIYLSNDDYENLANKLINNNQFTDVLDMLKGSNHMPKLKPSDDNFFENLESKLVNYYENIEDKEEKKKEIKKHAEYYCILPESTYKKLREYLLDADPYEFLSKLQDFPGDPLNDNEMLKKLAKKILTIETNTYYIRYLRRLIDAEPMIFNKYADKLIKESPFYREIFNNEFNGEINYLEKIKKIIQHEKSSNNKKVFEVIISNCAKYDIDKEELAKIFEDEGEDITKYPRFFSQVLYNRNHNNIELLLNTFDRTSKYADGYKVQDNHGYLGFIKDGEIIFQFQGTGEYGFDREYKEYKRNLPLNETISSLKKEGHINSLITHDTKISLQIKLPNGKTGTAHSLRTNDIKRDKDVEILDENGKHLAFIKGPEGTTRTVIASDKDTLYVCSYGDNNSYLSAYNTNDFSKKWETPLNNTKTSSIDIYDNEIITHDEKNNKIKYFDMTNGKQIEGKDDSIKEKDKSNSKKYNNWDLTTYYLISKIPGLKEGIEEGTKFRNEHLELRDFTLDFEDTKYIAIDTKNKRAFQNMGNYIAIFNKTGLIGIIPSYTSNLKFDQQTNCLIVSGYNKIDIFNEKALDTIIEESGEIMKKLK